MDVLHKSDPRMTAAYAENGVVYLGAPVVIDDYLLMTNFPVNDLSDLSGKENCRPRPRDKLAIRHRRGRRIR